MEDSEAVAVSIRVCSAAIRAAGVSGSPFCFLDHGVEHYRCPSGFPFIVSLEGDRATL